MAYDEGLAERLRDAMRGLPNVSERKMFGGLAMMVNGHMCVGITGEALMVRVGPDGHEAALAQPHARPMDFTGRPMKGFVYVDPAGFAADDDLQGWINRGLSFVRTLPPK